MFKMLKLVVRKELSAFNLLWRKEMAVYEGWCDEHESTVNGGRLCLVTVKSGCTSEAVDKIAASVPAYYAEPQRMANILKRLGKEKASSYLEEKIPTSERLRSGELGEILAAQHVNERTEFRVPINKLRWKDSRNMAMKGEDAIGVIEPIGRQRIRFLKVEAKSRKNLSQSAVDMACAALNADGGMPSSHALSFLADRLSEMGEEVLYTAITDAQLKDGVTAMQVEHMIFTFSGNNPQKFLCDDLQNCNSAIPRRNVGLQVADHQDFIKQVFEEVTK